MIDDDLENSGLRELIEKGREQGYITFADINDYLPDEVSDPDQLDEVIQIINCLLYTSPSPRDNPASRMPSSA